jgi:hypothetical protein
LKYLTKSKFKLASECPTKLFYTGKSQYANTLIDNPFLEALAEGGFQVGELAKYYYANGHNIQTLNYDDALNETNRLLEQENVIIFEAAVKFNNLFIRVDILVKRGSNIRILEVKSKSITDRSGECFLKKNGDGILAEWKPYLYDVAFQRYVVKSAFPDFNITSSLLLADINASASGDGINQKFRVVKDSNNRKGVIVTNTLSDEDISSRLLCEIPVDHYCDILIKSEFDNNIFGLDSHIEKLSKSYEINEKISPDLKKECRDCQFKASNREIASGLLSGYHECWKESLGWLDEDFDKPNVLDIWDYRKKDKDISEGRIKFSDFSEDDINPRNARGNNELTRVERQWLQIQKVQNNDQTIWLQKAGLTNEMNSWTYPLHFIDFETSTVAIPFKKDRRPYEGIAFQYSHHTVDENGFIEHKGEYINCEQGAFPNYDFLRHLKKELEADNGTIFRYHNHENTYLNLIYLQLLEDKNQIEDREELCNFIRHITKSTRDSLEPWVGSRSMVDLWVLVKKYYYNPATNGSNSLKDVLPATINSSDYLKDKYSKPIYGSSKMPSLNFSNKQWLNLKEGISSNPYDSLTEMFDGAQVYDNYENSEGIKDGGAAMIAYAKMQFEDLSDNDKNNLRKNLLRYCELDTLAMVMIYEAWKDWLKI